MHLRSILGRGAIEVRRLCPQLGALRHRFVECGRDQLESGHCSGTMADGKRQVSSPVAIQ